MKQKICSSLSIWITILKSKIHLYLSLNKIIFRYAFLFLKCFNLDYNLSINCHRRILFFLVSIFNFYHNWLSTMSSSLRLTAWHIHWTVRNSSFLSFSNVILSKMFKWLVKKLKKKSYEEDVHHAHQVKSLYMTTILKHHFLFAFSLNDNQFKLGYSSCFTHF